MTLVQRGPQGTQVRNLNHAVLYMYAGPNCFGCDTAHAIAHEMRTLNLSHDHIRVVDLGDPDPVRLASIFAVPTHQFNGRVLRLGNPEVDWLRDQLADVQAR